MPRTGWTTVAQGESRGALLATPPTSLPSLTHASFAKIFAVKFEILFESFFTVLHFINTATGLLGGRTGISSRENERSREKRRRQKKRKAYHIFLDMRQIPKSCFYRRIPQYGA